MTPRASELKKPEYRHPLQRFQKLMPHRIRRILLVASRYDSFLIGEDGRLNELLWHEFLDVNLGPNPWLTRVSTGERALAVAANRDFDMVLVTSHIRDMTSLELARQIKELRPSLPIVPLAFDDRELEFIRRAMKHDVFQRPYVWQGDFRLALGIMQSLEDRWNVEHDTQRVGVSSVILIEDSEHYYSSFLPMLYAELMEQSQRVVLEATNLQNKIMRLRARPKILHCVTYEQAEKYYNGYKKTILGIISDVRFPRGGKLDEEAGLRFVRMVRAEKPDLPILLQTNEADFVHRAREVKAEVVLKRSRRLLHDLSDFIHNNFGFGDFVFRLADGREVGRSKDLAGLQKLLQTVPSSSVSYHAQRNHFSTWLRARTEFSLAEELARYAADEFTSVDEIRQFLIDSIHDFRRERQSQTIGQFAVDDFHREAGFSQIGEGSLGGKARGLAFVRKLLSNYRMRRRFPNVEILVPSAVVLAVDVFDEFMESNHLLDFALEESDDAKIEERFTKSSLPDHVYRKLCDYVELVDYPIAVRSSSLLEDSQYFAFTGVYETHMIPNLHPDASVRVAQLEHAIKRVYASAYFQRVKDYIAATPYRLEEEKMAVILQRLVGQNHDHRFYPDFSGVARSHNFYPVAPMKAEDGIVRLALGLGEAVVAGHKGISFCPLYPKHPIHFSTPEAILKNAQSMFFALDLEVSDEVETELKLGEYGIEVANNDGTLAPVGSVYSRENHAVYDGMSRPGVPLVTFFPILKHNTFPLAEICQLLLEVGSQSMNRPVEIEFAVNLSSGDQPAEFAFLQMRPFVLNLDRESVDLSEFRREDLICSSTMVLGSGSHDDIHDILVVDRASFDRSKSAEVAMQVAQLNGYLLELERPYLLIGVGRWGASDPWLGIPVTWEQIAGARVIIESGLKDVEVAPSQGSHFFQNLITAGVSYFTVNEKDELNFVDWDWLKQQPAVESTKYVRLIHRQAPIGVKVDGKDGVGVICKTSTTTQITP